MDIKKFEIYRIDDLIKLLNCYKSEIGEEEFQVDDIARLNNAISSNTIEFYIAEDNDELVACCSISRCFSTYTCSSMGIFEDFYITKSYRKKGLASKLVEILLKRRVNNELVF